MPSGDIINDIYPTQGIRIAAQRAPRHTITEIFLKRLLAGKSGFVTRKRRQKGSYFHRITFHPVNLRNIRFADAVDVGGRYSHRIGSCLTNSLWPAAAAQQVGDASSAVDGPKCRIDGTSVEQCFE